MKTALYMKYADIITQLLAFIIPLGGFCLGYNGADFLNIYVSVGAVQLVSCVLNYFFLASFYQFDIRRSYQKAILFAVMEVSICLIVYAINNAAIFLLLMSGVIFLIASPLLALLYFYITYIELGTLQKLTSRKHYI